jgi:hypothetical protein
MSLSPSDTRELFARECSFPTDRGAVTESVGEVDIAAPNGAPVAVETVLERSEETEFETVAELHSTVLANLDDDHVGRKHYDDRSSNPERGTELSF